MFISRWNYEHRLSVHHTGYSIQAVPSYRHTRGVHPAGTRPSRQSGSSAQRTYYSTEINLSARKMTCWIQNTRSATLLNITRCSIGALRRM